MCLLVQGAAAGVDWLRSQPIAGAPPAVERWMSTSAERHTAAALDERRGGSAYTVQVRPQLPAAIVYEDEEVGHPEAETVVEREQTSGA